MIELRFFVWKLLVGYLPPTKAIQGETLRRRRAEYHELIAMHYTKDHDFSEYNMTNYKQILADVPRTMPEYPVFASPPIQALLTRVLYIWNVRHPASGYVQGINDLCTPFIVTYLGEYMPVNLQDATGFKKDLEVLGEETLETVEADVYWSLCTIIDRTQDVYTAHQPGAHTMLTKVKELVKRMNGQLFDHLEKQGVDFLQFAFRWVNCFLMREFTLDKVIRMWDTYFSEEEDFAVFHVYVCASFLLHWEKDILSKEFPGLLVFLQSLPTEGWKEEDIGILLAQAYQYKVMFHKTKHI